MDELAATARMTAAERARETECADALFRDPWAKLLAGDEALAALNALPAQVRDNSYTAIRTRVFDDWITSVTNHAQGLQQVVLLGAGMDTRAFRLRWRPGVQLWELDQPQVLGVKEPLLAQLAPKTGCTRHSVALDLVSDDLPSRLVGASFRPDLPTAWLAEGLLPYLKPEEAQHLLKTVGTLSAPGSHLVADFVSQDLIIARNAYLQILAGQGMPRPGAQFCFGTRDPGGWLTDLGWHVEWVKEPGDEEADFGRWSWHAIPREAPGYPRFFFVAAVCP